MAAQLQTWCPHCGGGYVPKPHYCEKLDEEYLPPIEPPVQRTHIRKPGSAERWCGEKEGGSISHEHYFGSPDESPKVRAAINGHIAALPEPLCTRCKNRAVWSK